MIVLDLFIKHSSNQVNTSFEQDAAFVSLKYIITFDRSLERLKQPSHLSHSIHLLTGISLSSRIIPYCLARMQVMILPRSITIALPVSMSVPIHANGMDSF